MVIQTQLNPQKTAEVGEPEPWSAMETKQLLFGSLNTHLNISGFGLTAYDFPPTSHKTTFLRPYTYKLCTFQNIKFVPFH